ncbi:hypothetical protein HUT19_41545 (plasmid) [Streptomyces sp. NA02950]|uniref:hypothetical protein n=1 Tax=Streptomyces sp. NA02950 TaxID=2742137 RepID=UPI001592A7B4|nr:hypothetical protein [Streptomyces sp. NA02950]QKV98209.1 hypothetical protein HUT19_41545 [Streptomyces sp. NA02950]
MRRDIYTPVNAEDEFDRAVARRNGIRLSMYADALRYSRDPDAMIWHDALKWSVAAHSDGPPTEAAHRTLEDRFGPRLDSSSDPEAPVWSDALRWAAQYFRGEPTAPKEFFDRFAVAPAYQGGEPPAEALVVYQTVRAAVELARLAEAMTAAGQHSAPIARQAEQLRASARQQAEELGMRGLLQEVDRRLGNDSTAAA